jgi:hypothetical protein
MLDAASRPRRGAPSAISARIDTILLWSALPGASRHTRGTDVDLSMARDPPGYRTADAAGVRAGWTFRPARRVAERTRPSSDSSAPIAGVTSGVAPEPGISVLHPPPRMRAGPKAAVLHAALTAAPLLGK